MPPVKNKQEILSALGFSNPNSILCQQAFTHSSYINEHPEDISYERLEFLGDAVLSLVSSTYLFTNYPEFPEGILTDMRAALVRTEKLAEISSELHLGDYGRFSKGEEHNHGGKNENTLADILEALLGAMYLEEGYSAVNAFFMKHFVPHLSVIIETKSYRDPKTQFQEIVQQQMKITPTYQLLKEDRELDEQAFTVAVHVAGKSLAIGTGKTKKAAESAAAAKAIGILDKK